MTNGVVKIHKMWCAVDTGWGSTRTRSKPRWKAAPLRLERGTEQEITIQNGQVTTLQRLQGAEDERGAKSRRISCPGAEEPGGIGERAQRWRPAHCQRDRPATGKRIYKLPIRAEREPTPARRAGGSRMPRALEPLVAALGQRGEFRERRLVERREVEAGFALPPLRQRDASVRGRSPPACCR